MEKERLEEEVVKLSKFIPNKKAIEAVLYGD
jgi:hypothetical protein